MKTSLVAALFSVAFVASSACAMDEPFEYSGFVYTSHTAGDYSSAESTTNFSKIKNTGANTVALNYGIVQDSSTSSVVYAGKDTPTVQDVTTAIEATLASGMSSVVRVYITQADYSPVFNIKPSDPAAWFASYTNEVVKLAKICDSLGVKMMVIGNEMPSMSTNPSYSTYWKALISSVRAVYRGKLSYNSMAFSFFNDDDARYSQNLIGNEWAHVTFWSDLDIIGLSAYPKVGTLTSMYSDYKTAWNSDVDGKNIFNEISKFHDKINKPIMFTEFGNSPFDGGNISSNGSAGMTFKTLQQADWFRAAYEVIGQQNNCWFVGVLNFDWEVHQSWVAGSYGKAYSLWTWNLPDKGALSYIKTAFTNSKSKCINGQKFTVASDDSVNNILDATITTTSSDKSSNNKYYVLAITPDGSSYALTKGGWAPAAQISEYTSNTSGTSKIRILDGSLNMSQLSGTVFYAGYGSSLSDVVNSSKYVEAYRIK